MSEVKHLWEYDHPFYCESGNYFSNDYYHQFGSWREFVEEGGLLYGGDDELNLVWRWDWIPGDDRDSGTLEIFYMLQRKAACLSVSITVSEADEDEVRSWLESRARKMAELWEPLLW